MIPPNAAHAVWEEDNIRAHRRALREGLELRGKCDRVLEGREATLAELERDEAALMHGDHGEVCSCAVARRTLDGLNAQHAVSQRWVVAAIYWQAGKARYDVACALRLIAAAPEGVIDNADIIRLVANKQQQISNLLVMAELLERRLPLQPAEATP